jgi:hypothetical protein
MSTEKETAVLTKIDTEACLHTAEGRVYLNQLKSVTKVTGISETTAHFIGEEIVKLGYTGEYKSIHLFRCPDGYFLFCNKTFSKNNWSASDRELDVLLDKVSDVEVVEGLKKELSAAPVT